MKIEKGRSKIALLTIVFPIAVLIFTCHGRALAGISKEGSDDYCNLCHIGGNATDGTTNQTCVECHSNTTADTIKSLNIEDEGEEIIMDNLAGIALGNWPESTEGRKYWASNYQYHDIGNGPDAFKWEPVIQNAGDYEVFAWWPAHRSHASAAAYTVYHDEGITEVVVNQTKSGGKWNSLGIYYFDGTNDYVELGQSASGYAIADAVRFKGIKVITDSIPVPVVYNNVEPGNPLAGGNFYWVAQGDDTKGHNVFENNPDNHWNEAPGRAVGCIGPNSCHNNIHGTNDLIGGPGLLNRQGCTKCHMVSDNSGPVGFHHADDSDTVVGSEINDSDGYYRFLKGHQSGTGHGVSGIEDKDWEATKSSADHNEYLGYVGNHESPGGMSHLGHTITGFCTGCHGNYHIQLDGGEIGGLHHPADWVLPGYLPHSNYTEYDPDVPVARPGLSSISNVVTPNIDMTMCLSCHAAHGSRYPHMLRKELGACMKCHWKW